MKNKAINPDIKGEVRALRKKANRLEKSRSLIKSKVRKKGIIIKGYQDRYTELEQNRDDWRTKCKDREKELIGADNKYERAAALLNIKEEQLREILKEFEELKKKYPLESQRR
jgi:chromosome segregation ATPase